MKEFLEENIITINAGIDFLEKKAKYGFKEELKEIGYDVKVVKGEKLNPYKNDPTETDSEHKLIKVTESYLKRNPQFFNFDDEVGWSWHEFGHAYIFAGTMNNFLKINSPFGYPMNTDEIFTFGFQIRHLNNSAFNKLVRYESSNSDDFTEILNMFRNVISN